MSKSKVFLNKTLPHKEKLKKLNEKVKIQRILRNLYELNSKDLNRKNDNLIKLIANEELILSSYNKLKKNKGSTTPGIDNETPDEFNLCKAELLSQKILSGKFEWTDIKRVMIPKPGKKKKRPLGIPSFQDKIIQENIRVVLTVIYEPLFQKNEYNHGFRPKRSTETAIMKLQRDSKEMMYALKGDIKGAFDNVNHQLFISILNKKIKDKKFLSLIKSGLQHNIVFESVKRKNLFCTPQGGIASPILFNIYMHEFDKYVQELTEKYLTSNEIEGRKTPGRITTYSRKLKSRIEKAKRAIEKHKIQKNLTPEIRKDINRKRIVMRTNKKAILHFPSTRMNSLPIRFAYSRYADDWILLSNIKEDKIHEIKDLLTIWLTSELKLELDQSKILITDLSRAKAKYLGFSLFMKKKRIIRKKNKNGTIFRQRSTVPLTIGIDHDRVRDRLIVGKIMDKKLIPRSNPLYLQLKPVRLILKYRQRLDGLYNYYFRVLTYTNELNQYYYAYKFSCLKTLARRFKKSIKTITLERGEKFRMETTYKQKILTKELKKKITAEFPTYREITQTHRKRSELKNLLMYKRIKKKPQNHSELELTSIENLLNHEWITEDPFFHEFD
jgi:group II intron reverse transcriptase/maturase